MTGRDWFLLIGLLGLASLIPVIWAIVDVVRRPPWQFSGFRKFLWVLVLGVGWLIVWPFALVSSVVYLTVLRRRFPDPSMGGPGPGPYYGAYPPQPPPQSPPLPPSGWYPDPSGAGGERWWDGRGWTEHVR